MASSNGPVGSTELLLEIDRAGEAPLHEQVERAVRDAVRGGRLAPGTRLPSTRALAAELGVSRGVVTEAYGQLAAEGYLLTRQGAPVRVARAVRPPRQQPASPSLRPAHRYRFDPTLPDVAGFPRDHWLRSLRFAWRQAPIDAIGYPDPRGLPALRQSLADYLGRARGAAADPEQILVCTGFTQAFSLLCRWLAERGIGEIALEDPSWHRQRLVAEQAGLRVVPVAVDDEGIDVEALTASGASAVVVTPAHQFPTGRVLGSERRAALIEWAEAGEGLIVEDDFDAEYRYDRAGVGALQGLAPERIAYIGSASKRLAPGIRLGWALLPSWLAWQLTPAKQLADAGSEVVGQLALHDFIERGELDRHIRRTRLRYQRRREALLRALARWLPGAEVGDGAAGLFELVRLPAGTDESALASRAAALGVGVETLGLHRFAASGDPGLVLGFGCLPEPAIERGVRLLGQAVAES
ncbi:MAG: PLP-dependent aminotransferase family protein [Solirubrobacterales bacterium]